MSAMLAKWKTTLTNWINCYLKDTTEKNPSVNEESLLNIISNLRDNFCLDESKSSKLEANTLEDFILEKYPDFKFKNGTVGLSSEDELYIVASLLLLFVCVNSKDVYLKTAMCSKLSLDDQETIMKFSKFLMECQAVTCQDIENAILESCGQQMASVQEPEQRSVAETPPALRSLHGEVRRLQAALDAEKFDRNYMQEELSRTQLKIEKLVKEKEQHKLDIINLRAKISNCCGGEAEARVEGSTDNGTKKLLRQVDELEQRLADTIAQLDDAVYERDAYKAKVDELKLERDKWLSFGQQETTRATQLADQLATERQNAVSLKEIIAELQQHNKNNGLNLSQLECDDLDTSQHSLGHNLSICNEACVNVVEVQLGEERAKVVELKKQIDTLQDQLHELTQKTEDEKLSLEKIISDKDTDILNLKHRINEEIEEKNNMKTYYNDEITQLSNEISELEQKVRNDTENFSKTIESKMNDVQTLQEEKLSLLQSLSDETTKLENIITDRETTIENLQSDLTTEKNNKQKIKDSYENHIMKLKEKVLNRNNELVELQNKLLDTSETMQALQTDLRFEKESKEKLKAELESQISLLNNQTRDKDISLRLKNEEIQQMHKQLEEDSVFIKNLKTDLDSLNNSKASLESRLESLEEINQQLVTELQHRDQVIEQQQKEVENMENAMSDQKSSLGYALDEKDAEIGTLYMQLQKEVTFRTNLQIELEQLHEARNILAEEFNKLTSDFSKISQEMLEKNQMIEAMDLYLEEEKEVVKKLKQDCHFLNETIKNIALKNSKKDDHMKLLKHEIKILEQEIDKKVETIEALNQQLAQEESQKDKLQILVSSLNEDKVKMIDDVNQICNEIKSLKDKNENLEKEICKNVESIEAVNQQIVQEISEKQELQTLLSSSNEAKAKLIDELNEKCNEILLLKEESAKLTKVIAENEKEKSKLTTRINKTERILKDSRFKSNKTIEENVLKIKQLELAVTNLEEARNDDRAIIEMVQQEKQLLVQKHDEQVSFKNILEKEYQYLHTVIKNTTDQLNSEIVTKNDIVTAIQKENQLISENLAIANNNVKALKKENEKLQFTIEEDNSNHEIVLKAKDTIIERLEQQLNTITTELTSLQTDYEKETLLWETRKVEMKNNLDIKNSEIGKLEKSLLATKMFLDQTLIENEKLKQEFNIQISNGMKERDEIEKKSLSLQKIVSMEEDKLNEVIHEKVVLLNRLAEERAEVATLQSEKQELINEKQELSENLEKEKLVKVTLQTKIDDLEENKKKLEHQLKQENETKEALEHKMEKLVSKKEKLSLKLMEELAANELLTGQNDTLTFENETLQQKLIEERAARALIQNEKHALATEKQILTIEKEDLNEKLNREKHVKEAVDQEIKQILISSEELNNQLIQEKTAKEQLEEEIKTLIAEKRNLAVEIQALKEQLKHVQEKEIRNLVSQTEVLNQQIIEETTAKDNFEKEKANLSSLNQTLIQKITDERSVHELLVQDKDILVMEKESLLKNFSEEKAARDELENEKQKQTIQIEELKKQHDREIAEKEEAIFKLIEKVNVLKNDFTENKKLAAKISNTLNCGLEKLLQTLRKEDIKNELLQKLTYVDESKELSTNEQCDLLVNIADTLTTELAIRKNLELALEHENCAMTELRDLLKQKEMQLHSLQTEYKSLEQSLSGLKMELNNNHQTHSALLQDKTRIIQKLQKENESLSNEIGDVKQQLEVKVHSLKEKLSDNENLTEKLKRTYENQIDNLNLMTNKLTNYLKDKSVELEAIRKEKEKLQLIIEENHKAIKSLEEEVKSEKLNQEKLITDFESERLVLKNMVTVTESVMEDQKNCFEKLIAEHAKSNEMLQEETKILNDLIEKEKQSYVYIIKEKDSSFEVLFKELTELRHAKELLQKEMETHIESLKKEITKKILDITTLEQKNKELIEALESNKKELAKINCDYNDVKNEKEALENIQKEMVNIINEQNERVTELKDVINEKDNVVTEFKIKYSNLEEKMNVYNKEVDDLRNEKELLLHQKEEIVQSITNGFEKKISELQTELKLQTQKEEELTKLRSDNVNLVQVVEDNKTVITNLEQLIKHELEQNQNLRQENGGDKLNLFNKCSILEQYQSKAEKEIEERRKEVVTLQSEINVLRTKGTTNFEEQLMEKDAVISTVSKELVEEKMERERLQKEFEAMTSEQNALKKRMEELVQQKEQIVKLQRENEVLAKVFGQRETFVAMAQENRPASSTQKYPSHEQYRETHQVDISPSDLTHSSTESIKTISDLEKILQDKNRTITTLQSDITYLKSLMADSENKLLDVTKELEMSKENCQQLSNQLKKIVHAKNEEIAELKKQVSKMSVTETRASQIIKVSAKYQAIILKRIAEIKSNTVLKELTNFGNQANCDSEVKRSLVGSITMEDLENFLETTDRHLKRCQEKQAALQKERDRLYEVNKINESEIINMKKFLTELSVSFKTFNSVKDLYTQKISRIVSLQRTVRREILNLDGRITDAAMCKLERGYAAAIQDLAECAMNLERWVERSIARTISPEKIKQAYTSEIDRASISSGSFQNTSLEVQLEELENTFQKVLEEIARVQKGEGAKDKQSVTVMEVRAEYEDKLNRMKAKMKQLYQEQISIFREKQKEEIAVLERELQKARDKLAETSKTYEEHIKSLTTELWSVGEKFLMKKDEAEWLRRKRSDSLQSLQHVHSSGLTRPPEDPARSSDTYSLRSLPVHHKKSENRGLHMSDEEGEVFDNRWLHSLNETPRRRSPPHTPAGARLSELKWRNSLCPPHLKSSYPAETQFAHAHEEDIKFSLGGGSKQPQRKEIGITAYKKPGPPTPSKQAGRLSANSSELRESLRPDPEVTRKTSTPSRLKALFRSSRTDNNDGTPRSRRLSIFRSKK